MNKLKLIHDYDRKLWLLYFHHYLSIYAKKSLKSLKVIFNFGSTENQTCFSSKWNTYMYIGIIFRPKYISYVDTSIKHDSK